MPLKDLVTGVDRWGYGEGELQKAILEFVPDPPATYSAGDIACQLAGQRPDPKFVAMVRWHLGQLSKRSLVRSVPLGSGNQLGWHRRIQPKFELKDQIFTLIPTSPNLATAEEIRSKLLNEMPLIVCPLNEVTTHLKAFLLRKQICAEYVPQKSKIAYWRPRL